MNTPFYRPPSKEGPPFDKTHIPRHQIKRKVQLRKEKRLQIGEGDTVLVVDDDLIFLEILSSGYAQAKVFAGDHPELPQVFFG